MILCIKYTSQSYLFCCFIRYVQMVATAVKSFGGSPTLALLLLGFLVSGRSNLNFTSFIGTSHCRLLLVPGFLSSAWTRYLLLCGLHTLRVRYDAFFGASIWACNAFLSIGFHAWGVLDVLHIDASAWFCWWRPRISCIFARCGAIL